jgi:hypothetical protein
VCVHVCVYLCECGDKCCVCMGVHVSMCGAEQVCKLHQKARWRTL